MSTVKRRAARLASAKAQNWQCYICGTRMSASSCETRPCRDAAHAPLHASTPVPPGTPGLASVDAILVTDSEGIARAVHRTCGGSLLSLRRVREPNCLVPIEVEVRDRMRVALSALPAAPVGAV